MHQKLVTALAALLTAAAATTHAADFDEIIVSGARSPLSLNQVGSAATVITREQIEARESRHVTDLLRSVPGFSVSHTGVAGSQTQIRVRGAEANHILVLIDGVRVNDPATGDEFRWEYLSTANIERIEVVRGPQSSLWGSDAVAAVVHIITRTGAAGRQLDGYVEAGSFATTNAGFNGSVGADGWSLSAAVEHLQTDGSNVSRVGDEDDDADLTTFSFNGKLQASDVASFDFGVRAVDAYSQFDPVDFFVTGLPTDGDRATATDNLDFHISSKISPRNSRVDHHVSARYFESDNRNLSDGVEASSASSDRFSFAYQADIRIGDELLALALEHEQTNFEQTGAVVFGDPNQQQNTHVSSAIAEYQWLSGERLTLIVGGRFDDNSDFDDSFNGRLSLSYQLSDATTLRSSFGTGQKNPTFIELFGFFPGQFSGNPALKPELSTSYDLGVNLSLLGDQLQVQASVFHQDLSDEIITVFDPTTFFASPDNAALDSARDGVEVAMRMVLSEQLEFGAHYTYTDASERDFSGAAVSELRRPRHSGGLSANFRSREQGFSAMLNADYGGTRSDIFFPPFPSSSEIVTLSNYWLVDLAMQYQVTDSLTAFARGSNLLDEDYEQVFGYQTLGRAAYVGVRMRFGD